MAAPTAAGTAPATTKLAHDATFLTTNARHSSPAVHSKAFLGPGGGEEEEEGGGRGPAQPHCSRRHHHPTTSRSLPSTATFAPPPNMKHRSTALPEASSTTSNLPPVAEVAANNNKNRNRPPTLTTDTAAPIDPNTRSTTATLLSPSAAADWVTTTPTCGGGGIVDSATNPNHPGSNSPMLSTLSPSRTITSSLTTLVSSTAKQLEVIWDKVGYAPEDRALQLRQLLASFQDLCQAKLVEESSVADTFQQTIVESRLEIARLCRALHASPPPSLSPSKDPQLAKLLVGNNETSNRKQNNNESESDNDDVECANTSTTLMDQLATLEAALEGLQSAAETVRNELVACREFIVEAHNALGSELDPTWLDIDSDLSLERRDAFVRHKDELGHEVASRSATVVQLVRDCRQLMNELQLGPDFSDDDNHKEEAGDKDEDDSAALDQRIYGSIVLGKDGGYVLASKHRSNTCVGISSRAVDELTKRFAVLHAEKRRRRVLLQNMGAEIAPLWDKLKVPEAQQQAFMESVQGLGLDTIRKGQAELDRLRSLKAAQLGTLIDEARDTICALWKEVHHPLEQQQAFRREYMATDKIPTDELLEQHEEYISELQRRLEQMRPIVRQIERREDIVRERQEYEELQKDPDRLKQRGAALTRQLLEEEKMARRIKKDLPRLTELLDVTLRQWKVEHGEDFRYGDDNDVYLDVMERQEDEWQRYRELEQQRKIKKKQEEHTADLRPGKLHLPGKENFAVKVVRQQQQHQPLGVVGVSRPLQDAPGGAGKRVATTAVSARGVGPSLPHLLSHKYK